MRVLTIFYLIFWIFNFYTKQNNKINRLLFRFVFVSFLISDLVLFILYFIRRKKKHKAHKNAGFTPYFSQAMKPLWRPKQPVKIYFKVHTDDSPAHQQKYNNINYYWWMRLCVWMRGFMNIVCIHGTRLILCVVLSLLYFFCFLFVYILYLIWYRETAARPRAYTDVSRQSTASVWVVARSRYFVFTA